VSRRRGNSLKAGALKGRKIWPKAIDSLPVHTNDIEETASRKRRLLKGPEEFRDVRVDRAKK
jgi:hypothetical protein